MSDSVEPQSVRVIFVRHGETQHNVAAVISSGDPGMPLTDRGRRQAEEASRALASTTPKGLVSSPLLRARETAAILGDSLGLVVAEDRDLRECGVGDLEGKSDGVSFEVFDAALEAWHLRCESDVPLGPGGEAGEEVAERFGSAVRRAVRLVEPGETVLVVCHQTILLYGVAMLCENLLPDQTYRRFIPNLGTIEVLAKDGGFRCAKWGGTEVNHSSEERS